MENKKFLFEEKFDVDVKNLSNYEVCIDQAVRDNIEIFEKELANIGIKCSIIYPVIQRFLDEYIDVDDIYIYFYDQIHKPYLIDGLISKILIILIEVHALKSTPWVIKDVNELSKRVFMTQIEIYKSTSSISSYSMAKKGADARHKENRDCRADVFKWADKNMKSYKSMDAAALAIAEKLVPQKFRAVRQWLTDWKKLQKLRSTGTT
ncbi:hypothetical protein [Comamonas testosteroni]|uniref:Uncharacterized protein n=1 Tax=Comamonas testosteroni TaxID=285 RepID=A0A8B4S9Z9_COMTE|nr:hypothetical protein [Comamonas testosteroni]QQN72073.1 hypothetical protein IYN88_12080 [Comamonas testosteroni]SUY79243.1 Uncharacterised protein [Comamonas testosteroni]